MAAWRQAEESGIWKVIRDENINFSTKIVKINFMQLSTKKKFNFFQFQIFWKIHKNSSFSSEMFNFLEYLKKIINQKLFFFCNFSKFKKFLKIRELEFFQNREKNHRIGKIDKHRIQTKMLIIKFQKSSNFFETQKKLNFFWNFEKSFF